MYIFNSYVITSNEHMSMKDPYLNKVLELNNIEIDIDNLTIKQCISNNNCKEKIYKTKYFNPNDAHIFAKNKHISNEIFLKNGIPVPKHVIITNDNKNNFINNTSIPFPCVLKPIDGMQGKDVHTFIRNITQFNKILIELLEKYDKVMFEEQVYGNNYRIFVFNNKIIDIIEREQPYITGNGKSTIMSLIEQKNEDQIKRNLYPIKNISWDDIYDKGLNENSVLDVDDKLFITNTINFHNGANPVRIYIDDIPLVNLNMFIKAHKLGNLECSGIDYMSDDIRVPYYENNGHIIEINDMVDTKIHIDADDKKDPYFLFNNIVKNIF